MTIANFFTDYISQLIQSVNNSKTFFVVSYSAQSSISTLLYIKSHDKSLSTLVLKLLILVSPQGLYQDLQYSGYAPGNSYHKMEENKSKGLQGMGTTWNTANGTNQDRLGW